MKNPLSYAPEGFRLGVYITIAVLVILIEAAQLGYAAVDVSNPAWLTVAGAVVPYLAVALGLTAATHVRPSAAHDDPPKH